MTEPSPIVAEFAQMALDADPASRETNLSVAASLMNAEERDQARQAALAMLAHLAN